jgi:hypothetical protein
MPQPIPLKIKHLQNSLPNTPEKRQSFVASGAQGRAFRPQQMAKTADNGQYGRKPAEPAAAPVSGNLAPAGTTADRRQDLSLLRSLIAS